MNETIEKIREKVERASKEKNTIFKSDTGGVIPIMAALTVGLIFGRYHLIFGAFPLGIAAVSALPTLVWPTLIGAIVGSLTLGADNLIFAACTGIALLVRLFTCKGREDEPLFGEGLMLRMCAAIIGGFVAAVYECIVSGFSLATVLHSLTMILLTPLLTFVFSGLFSKTISITDLFSGKDDLSLKGKSDVEKYDLIFFQCSSLVTLFLISISLSEMNIFGIGADFIFVSLTSLLIAKKFGAPRAMAAGFVSALGSSGISAVSFALVGLVSGLLFPFGVGGALLSAGAAASVWSIYASGVEGLLTILPEYAIAATIAAPMLKSVSATKPAEEAASVASAAEMVGIFSLSYKNKFSGSLDVLEASMASISSVLRSASSRPELPTEEELRRVIEDSAIDICEGCGEFLFCKSEDIFPAEKNKDKLLEILLRGERVHPSDINTATEFCATPERIAERINLKVAELYQRKFQSRASLVGADQYDLVGKLISEARLADRREKAQDTPLTERLTKELHDMGFRGAAAKVFGERKKQFIIAMEDEDGKDITRPEILRKIEEVCGLPVITPEFFRKDNLALLECSVGRGYDAEFAFSSSSGTSEISGDTSSAFSSTDGRFYAICSDGMGSGDEAKRTSDFACKFLKCTLGIGSPETALHLLNSTLLGRGGECSATVDIFALDLLDGSATFIKSGAAPSFVKRDNSIFRIKSSTAPIGLMKTIDSERICVEVKGGDYVIMFSDGVSEIAEESPWLLELLTKPAKETPKAYADHILEEAKKHSKSRDDMSVIVVKIIKSFP
jgi:stage II sporulation protein E